MRVCYLHIGPHKTATTTIQACLFNNAPLLAQRGLYVPDMVWKDSRSHHHELARELSTGDTRLCRDRLAAELRAKGLPERIVISSEVLSQRIRTPVMRARIERFFSGLGYRVSILAYIRPQIASVNSFYTQKIKTFQLDQTFDQFFESFITEPAFDHHTRFLPLVEDKRFSLEFAPFASALLRAGICGDFLARVGLPQSEQGQIEVPAAMNQSPGPKTVTALLTIASHVLPATTAAQRERLRAAGMGLRNLATMLGWDKTRFNGLTAAHKERLMARFAPANEALAQRVWRTPWSHYFAADEAKAMAEPPSRFDPADAAPAEREEFEALCDYGLQVIRNPDGILDEDAPEAGPSFPQEVAAADRRRQRARRALRRRTGYPNRA